jgi:D-xylose transport system permease protein
MSEHNNIDAPVVNALDQSTTTPTLGEYLRNYFNRLRAGDLGNLPIIIGLVVIAIIFQSQNENFLTPRNFVSLILQMAGITVIAYGIVFVLLIGEIDLSVGYVSAVGGVSMTILLLPPYEYPWYIAVGLALLATTGIGLLQGVIITAFQVPPFVVTLAGFLAWNGLVLRIIGDGGTVIVSDKTVLNIANYYLPESTSWALAVAFIVVFAAISAYQFYSRYQQGLATKPVPIAVAQVVFVAALTLLVVYICNEDPRRGFPFVALLMIGFMAFLTFMAESTQYGRFIYAVGGNIEAARRAGIRVQWIRASIFMISGFMAGMGGIILASRLRSVDTGAGGGNLLLNSIAAAVIGGVSLYGGSGHVYNAIFGALVIASVDNGMGLLGLSSGNKFMITGFVLLIAVIVDAISSRRQKQSGLA